MNNYPIALVNDYRDLRILRERMEGKPVKSLAMVWGCSVRTINSHLKATASEMMRQVFVATQGDPEHPSSPRWTIEEFTADPRDCLKSMTLSHIENLERSYPDLKRQHPYTSATTLDKE